MRYWKTLRERGHPRKYVDLLTALLNLALAATLYYRSKRLPYRAFATISRGVERRMANSRPL